MAIISTAAKPRKWRILVLIARFVFRLAAIAFAGWFALAAFYQAPSTWKWPIIAAGFLVGLIAILTARRRLHFAGVLLLAAMLAVSYWWSGIKPNNNREWAADVAHGVTATITGDQIILHNVRNFQWRTTEDFDPFWQTEQYDLATLRSVDLLNSVWSNPAIAHTLVSFGFADGRHVVFSAEIRKERGEAFSEIGGFFKEFELVLIAAEESDIVRLRTNIRRETVSLYPLRVSPQIARALFLSYLEKANALAAQPEFYQTITANCTTIVFKLARLIDPGIPLDWRIIASGYLPDYLYDRGLVRTDLPLDQVRKQAAISSRALAAPAGSDYSRAMRSTLDGG
ncbi:DUF4105 domain-containing protein [Rhizobium sp. BK068]|uniref:Lnb N-terminal periplasmic domain-containing protein n=1 Tax=Rhizobium sp. BK068 TaxID=2512130 RepID=UPI001045A23E|nr:DUF4105 domain-containing protein [Rhizobium sp. BK068]TCM64440.1 uncharacterized protein DUF4105 [Rhizobium sp. BK068]